MHYIVFLKAAGVRPAYSSADLAAQVSQYTDLASQFTDQDLSGLTAQISQYTDLASKFTDQFSDLQAQFPQSSNSNIDVEPKFVYDPENPNARFDYNIPLSAEAEKYVGKINVAPLYVYNAENPVPFNYKYTAPNYKYTAPSSNQYINQYTY